MNKDEYYIRRCIEIAKLGKGKVSPNPLVGCVIVFNNKIIGEGFHKKYRFYHAEINAINSVVYKDKIKDATIYVSLEPCCHYGNTPPCVNEIIKLKPKRVVIGTLDANPKVSGKSVELLKNVNIDVTVGVCEKELYELNKFYFTNFRKKRPYVKCKWAETKDGFIDKLREDGITGKQNIISGSLSRIMVDRWRSDFDATMVGTNTLINDNPNLHPKLFPYQAKSRVVIDRNLKCPKSYNVYNNNCKTIIINCVKDFSFDNTVMIKTNDYSEKNILHILFENNIRSVLIEGGTKFINNFLKNDLVDEICKFKSKKIEYFNGVKAPEITEKFKLKNREDFKDDFLFEYINE